MRWNNHSKDIPKDSHAFLSGSKYSWINYDDEKIKDTFKNFKAIQLGTRLHAFAAECIKLKRIQPEIEDTVCMYINDAIRYQMDPEVQLYFSKFAFGTADAISFKDGFLRIHDLKTGKNLASIHQLEIYASYFCLEYAINPKDIEIELRIYQNNEIKKESPSIETILGIMDKTVRFNEIIFEMEDQVYGY